MSTFFRAAVLTVSALSSTLMAQAHPGHGEPGPTHYVTEPSHVLPVVMVASLVLCVAAALRGSRQRASK
ncbi:hypothetical protein [Rubripirellula reticaptiva]|uniref:hypothetical protein n=1 Tax=Rubripirellula reticaptiva TaxID=2528013 RepID=UPI0011B6D581|nr:hypothetical protein [Rubripirellula reticaptiva]